RRWTPRRRLRSSRRLGRSLPGTRPSCCRRPAATSGIGWIRRGRLSKLGVRLGDNRGGVRVEAIERPLLRLGRLELDAGLRALRPGLAASDLVVTATVEVPVSDSEPQYAWEV